MTAADMTATIIVLFAAAVVALECIWAVLSLKHLSCVAKFSTDLTEPNEPVIQSVTIKNTWFFPIMYCGALYQYTKGFGIAEDERNSELLSAGIGGAPKFEYTTYLKPHTRKTVKVSFIFAKRGKYSFGEHIIEAGDVLGISSKTRRRIRRDSIVVMPYRCKDQAILRTLGGFMGDVSVRRFIYEDPILTIGCRDYTGKEPMKNISWQHTARAGKVLVNQYDHTAESNVCIVLNIDGDSRFDIERCYEITRSVCEELEKRKIAYEFFTNADLEGPLGNKFSWVEAGLGRRHFGTIMYGLGCSRCICRHPFGWLIEQCKKRRRVALSYIVITPELSADAKLRLNELQAISEFELCVLEGHASSQEGAA